MFKKKFSKKATGIIVGAFALTCAAIGGIKVAACDDCEWKDTKFFFDFNKIPDNAVDGYCSTKFRRKENTSKVYIKCNAAGDDFYVKIRGNYTDTDQVGPADSDCSYGETAKGNGALISQGTVKYLRNIVRERGLTHCALEARPVSSHKNYTAQGVWSPDNYNHRSAN